MKEKQTNKKKNVEIGVKSENASASPPGAFWMAGAVILLILFFYLPFDHGGFYPVSRAFLAIMAFLFLSMKILFPTGEKYPKFLVITSTVFFSFVLISVVFSTDVHNSVLEFIYMLSCAVGFILGYCYITRKDAFRNAAYVIMVNLFITSLFGILTFIIQKSGEARAYGRFFQADILGGFLVIFIPLVIMISLIEKKWPVMGIAMFVSAISISTLFLTFSRGAVLSFLIVTPFILWYGLKFQSLPKILLRSAFIVVLVVIIIFSATNFTGRKNVAQQQLEERIEEIREAGKGDGSSMARLNFYSAAFKIAMSHPLTGTGPGTFGYHFPQYQEDVKFFSKYSHNYYLWVLSQSGFPALIAFLTLLLSIAVVIFRRIKKFEPSDGFTKPAAFALSMGLISSLAHINLDVDFHFAGITFTFFGVAGILAGLGQEDPEIPERKPSQRIFAMVLALFVTILMFPPLLYYFSLDLQKMGDNAGSEIEALNYYKQAVKVDPWENEARRKLGLFYHNRGKYNDALEQLNYSIKLSPYRARNYDNRGRTLDALARFDEAAADYKRAIELDPMNQLFSFYGLGMSYHRKGDDAGAMEIFNRAVNIYKEVNFKEVWHFRANQLKPQVSLIYVTIGDIYISIKDYANAAKAYENAARYDENAAVCFGAAFSHFSNGEWSKSLDSFRQLIWLEDYDLPYYYISECYRKLGYNELAEKNLRIYFKIHKELEDRKKREEEKKRSDGEERTLKDEL